MLSLAAPARSRPWLELAFGVLGIVLAVAALRLSRLHRNMRARLGRVTSGLTLAVLAVGLVWAPNAWSRPSPKPRQLPAACKQLWTGIVKVVEWNPRYKIIRMDSKKHLLIFSVGDAGKPSEGELSASPRRVGRTQCGLEVGFVTTSIGGMGLLRAEAALFAQMVEMETTSHAEPALADTRLPPLYQPAWMSLVDVATAHTTYKPSAVDQKRHFLSLTLAGRSAAAWRPSKTVRVASRSSRHRARRRSVRLCKSRCGS